MLIAMSSFCDRYYISFARDSPLLIQLDGTGMMELEDLERIKSLIFERKIWSERGHQILEIRRLEYGHRHQPKQHDNLSNT